MPDRRDTWPLSASCGALCNQPCCSCGKVQGNEGWWQGETVHCANECGALRAEWAASVESEGLRACATVADCHLVGWGGTCNGDPSVTAGCGDGVNGRYAGSHAADVERAYLGKCIGGIADCAPPDIGCVAGRCVVTKTNSCFSLPDAGP